MNNWRNLQETNNRRLIRKIRQTQPYKDIFEAIQNGDTDAVKDFVEKQNVDVNSRAPGNSGTVLGSAAGAGHQHIVEYLVARGADVNAKDKFGYNSLLWALDKDAASLDLIKYLVTNGADVNAAASNTRYTPLHWAASHNKLDIVQYLLEHNANINAETKDGNTPYTLARANGHTRLATYLTNDKNIRVTGDIFAAAASGNIGLVLHMVENERIEAFAKNKNGDTPLHIAAANNKVEVVKYFLDLNNSQVNVKNDKGETPLIVASAGGHLVVVRYLLEIKYANPESVDRLGNTPLLSASKNGHVDVLRYLIENANVDINAKDNDSSNVLHSAAQYGRMNVIKYLVDEKRYPIHAKNNKGETVLHIAARHGFLDIVKYFVDEKGMEIAIVANDGRNVLHKACESNNAYLLKYLINEKNADTTTKDRNQNTLLHIAVENGRLDLVRYLVDEKGFDVFATNNAGYNAITLAKVSSKNAIYRYFTIEKGMTERPPVVSSTTRRTSLTPTTTSSPRYTLLPSSDTHDVNATQTYIFNGQAVDSATRDRLVREFLQNGIDNLSTREESFTNNGRVTVKYFINGIQVDLATRNKIINDYKNSVDGKFQFTKYYVNGQEVDQKTRNDFLNQLQSNTVPSQQTITYPANEPFGSPNNRNDFLNKLPNGPLQNPYPLNEPFNNQNTLKRNIPAGPSFNPGEVPYLANGPLATGRVSSYRVNGQIVDEGTYVNTMKQNNLPKSVNVGFNNFVNWDNRKKRSTSSDDQLGKVLDSVEGHQPWIEGGEGSIGRLPLLPGRYDRSTVHHLRESSSSVNNLLPLIDMGARYLSGNRYKRYNKHESLLSPKELIENRIDYDAIKAIRDYKR